VKSSSRSATRAAHCCSRFRSSSRRRPAARRG